LIKYFVNPDRWAKAIRHPEFARRALLNIIRYPQLLPTTHCEGLISWNLGALLYENVLKNKAISQNIIEVGAFKGLSTCYLSRAAACVGKRVKSFELFTGLPVADANLDPIFHAGQFSSDVDQYDRNVKAYGCRDVVDLIIGDARQTLLPAITGEGFAFAFLDVDVYAVMRELLFQLWSLVQGGEVIIVHDADQPGVRKAIDEFQTVAEGHLRREIRFENGTSSVLAISDIVVAEVM
jgi:predicted O-methyltransferase YrrM